MICRIGVKQIYRSKLEGKECNLLIVDQKSFQDALKDIPKKTCSEKWVSNLYEDILNEISKMR
jgi:hypothetical protein